MRSKTGQQSGSIGFGPKQPNPNQTEEDNIEPISDRLGGRFGHMEGGGRVDRFRKKNIFQQKK